MLYAPDHLLPSIRIAAGVQYSRDAMEMSPKRLIPSMCCTAWTLVMSALLEIGNAVVL